MAGLDNERDSRQPVAYVTGGTRGIGWAVVQALAKAGYDVTASSRSARSVSECRDRIASSGIGACAEVADVGDEGAISASIARTGGGKGPDVLVCCAGGAVLGNAETLSMAEWDRCMDLNLRSAFFCAKTAMTLMRESGRGGSVVFISSIWAQVTPRDRVGYATAKAALTTLARTLAIDHAKHGIRVNCVAPGFVETDLLRRSLAEAAERSEGSETIETLRARHPLGRLVTAEDVAKAVVFLAGPDAMNITAQTLFVDGGLATQFGWG